MRAAGDDGIRATVDMATGIVGGTNVVRSAANSGEEASGDSGVSTGAVAAGLFVICGEHA